MAKLRTIAVLVALGLLHPGTALGKSIIETRVFEIAQLKTETVTIGEAQYTEVKYPGLECGGEIGWAALPYIRLKFQLPLDAKDVAVTVENIETENVQLEHPLKKNPVPITTNGYAMEDSDLEQNQEVPEIQGWPAISSVGKLFGICAVAEIDFSPILFKEEALEFDFIKRISLSVSYASSQNDEARILSADDINDLAHAYVNGIIPSTNEPVGQADASSTSGMFLETTSVFPVGSSGIPAYQYMVITNRDLASAFTRLVGWKRQKGYTAGVVCIEDILADQAFSGGDSVSGINDDAGKLRAFLKSAHAATNGTRYVLLGGDASIVPSRYAKTISESGYDYTTNAGLTPTDAYFCDFDGNWDANGDGLYGEYQVDTIDLFPEIFVGRLMANTDQDVRYYTNKLIKYEINPGNGDAEYLGRAFLTQSDRMLYYHEADSVVNHIQNKFPDITVFSELPTWNDSNPTFPTGNDVIEELKNSTPALMSFHGHGNPYGIVTMQTGSSNGEPYGIVSKQDMPRHGDGHHMHLETAHGIELIENKDFPGIAYSIACTVMPFDSFPNYTNYINFGKSFTSGGNYGGPAFISNTRYGYIDMSVDIEKQFLDYAISNNGVGCSHALSKTSFSSRGTTYYHCALSCNLLGCPEFEMWTSIPAAISSGSMLNSTVSQIDLTTNTMTRGTIATSYSIPTSSSNAIFTIRKSNHLPCLSSVSLQGIGITYDGYYFVNDLTLGASQISGNVNFSRCTIGFEAFDSIAINPGFVVNNGGDVTLVCHGSMTINGGQVNSGGKLTIYCDNVRMTSQITCASGGNILWQSINNL